MPFSSSPVYVGNGDQIEIRYPTPSTWNTSVTIQVQIGTGVDPDGVTLGTRIPVSKPAAFTFTDNSGSTNSAASLPSDFVSIFQKNTTYYSNTITVSGLDLRVPIKISSTASGPKGTYPNKATSSFSINGGTYLTEATHKVTVTGTTTSGSKSITNISSTTGLSVGKYISSTNISGEILSISGTTVTLTNPASASGTGVSMDCFFTVTNNDVIRLKTTTENWYTTNTNVTLTLSDNYWGAGNTVSDTWSITTRAQDQLIDTLTNQTFVDFVDVRQSSFGSYKTQNISITGIDNDVVLRSTATGDCQISSNGTTWSQSLTNLKLGDTLYTRIAIGSTYTTKTTGTIRVYAVGGDTATIGGSTYENNNSGTYGSSNYAVTQVLGDTQDAWQVWTEVDRYPNQVTLAPIYTRTDSLPLATVSSGGTGYTSGNTYTTTNLTTPGATGLTVKVLSDPSINNAVVSVEVVERGSGYQVDDILRINGGATLAQIKIIQYRLVNVSSTHTLNNAEPGFTYYADFTIGGLGTEYPANTYSDLEAPFSGTASASISTTATSNQTVQISCNVTQGGAVIRKNGAGNWVQQLYVQNGDVVTIKETASSGYNFTKSSTITMIGPPQGGPLGNPTGGPNPGTFTDITDTWIIKTRAARTDPYPFKAQDIFNANLGTQYIVNVNILGLDLATDAAITSAPSGSNAQLSIDGVNYGQTITVPANATVLYIRATAPILENSLSSISYRVGNTTDTFLITTKKDTFAYNVISGSGKVAYETFLLPEFANEFDIFLVGAGGGNGGDDAPNSFGGRGGKGNLFVGKVNIPDASWPDPLDKTIRIYAADKGGDGITFSKGAAGGNGGFGYATGGKGGNAAPGEYSGGGGGGGGATAITLSNGTVIAIAGGGGGGGGAGDDTVIQKASQNGNNSGNGATTTSLSGLNLTGLAGQNNTTAGGGGGGAGGGYGTGGTTNTSLIDEFSGVIATTDLDANGGSGGGIYYNSTFVTPSTTITPGNKGSGSGRAGYVVIASPPQDVTPDPFTFVKIENALPAQEYFSEYVQITGISGSVSVSLTSNALIAQVRVCTGNGTGCGSWTSSATVKNNQWIQVKMQLGPEYYTVYSASVTVGSVEQLWLVETGAPPDTSPNNFNIPNKIDQPINTYIESDIVPISGLTAAVPITASNGAQISICNGTNCDTYANSPRTISNNQGFKLRILSSSSYSSSVSTSVTVGSSNAVQWTVTTEQEPDNTPDGFTFFNLTNQQLSKTVFSNSATIQNIGNTITFSVTGGATLIVNDVDLGVSSTTVAVYDVVKLKYTTSNIVGDSKTFNVTAGTFTTTWTVTNAGQFGTSPTPFTFATKTATAVNTATNSDSITIAGLGTTVGAFATNGARLSKNGGSFNVYTSAAPLLVSNGDTLRVQLTSSGISGFGVTTDVTVGAYSTTFTVLSPAPTPDPILGQWYSSVNMIQTVSGNQIKFATKFDGLPIGSMMPVFKNGQDPDGFGNLNGKADSRFPGWIYCDFSYVLIKDYYALYEVIGTIYGATVDTTSATSSIDTTPGVPANTISKVITVGSASNLAPGLSVYTTAGSSVELPAGTLITKVDGNSVTLSQAPLQTGSFTLNTIYQMRLPDMRNKKVMGVGQVDGNASSSPSLVPDFGPAKTSSNKSNIIPGSHGGLWFISKIATPNNQTIPQVETAGVGLTPTESDYFAIAQIQTTGYTNVSGQVEFVTSGSIKGNISLKYAKQYEVPFHQHLLVTGQRDPGLKGIVRWGGNGGRSNKYPTTSYAGQQPYLNSVTVQFNLWGYALNDLTLKPGEDGDTIRSTAGRLDAEDDSTWWQWLKDPAGIETWDEPSGYYGNYMKSPWGNITLLQPGLKSGTANYNEINTYINLATEPPGANASGSYDEDNKKFVTTIDVPEKSIGIQAFAPTQKLNHNHYLSLTQVTDTTNTFSYGNSNEHGTANGSTPTSTTVELEFDFNYVGLEILPGQFTLNQNKQLIPTPSLDPQTEVPLITPYTWVRWLIKAY